MSWYFECDNIACPKEFDDYDDLVFVLISMVKNKLEYHDIRNIYIFHNQKLFILFKASEIDQLSFYAHNWNKKQQDTALRFEYSKIQKNTMLYLQKIFYGMEEITEEDYVEVNKMIEDIDAFEYDMPTDKYESLMSVKEYKLCFDSGRNTLAKVNRIYFTSKCKFENINKTVKVLKDIYKIQYDTEERAFVMAFDSAMNLIGVLPLSHGNETSCDIDCKIVYKFLLLVGAAQFYVIHNHPNGTTEMSEADYEKTILLEGTSEMLDIKMLDHILISKNESICLLPQAHEIMGRDILEKNEYNNFLFN